MPPTAAGVALERQAWIIPSANFRISFTDSSGRVWFLDATTAIDRKGTGQEPLGLGLVDNGNFISINFEFCQAPG